MELQFRSIISACLIKCIHDGFVKKKNFKDTIVAGNFG